MINVWAVPAALLLRPPRSLAPGPPWLPLLWDGRLPLRRPSFSSSSSTCTAAAPWGVVLGHCGAVALFTTCVGLVMGSLIGHCCLRFCNGRFAWRVAQLRAWARDCRLAAGVFRFWSSGTGASSHCPSGLAHAVLVLRGRLGGLRARAFGHHRNSTLQKQTQKQSFLILDSFVRNLPNPAWSRNGSRIELRTCQPHQDQLQSEPDTSGGAPARTRQSQFYGPRQGSHFLLVCFLLMQAGVCFQTSFTAISPTAQAIRAFSIMFL
jgi:hypothetical protein